MSHVTLTQVTLADVGGLEEAKEALFEMIVLPRQHPEQCRRYNAWPPKVDIPTPNP